MGVQIQQLNFNELTRVDNGTCIQVVEGCTNPESFEFR